MNPENGRSSLADSTNDSGIRSEQLEDIENVFSPLALMGLAYLKGIDPELMTADGIFFFPYDEEALVEACELINQGLIKWDSKKHRWRRSRAHSSIDTIKNQVFVRH